MTDREIERQRALALAAARRRRAEAEAAEGAPSTNRQRRGEMFAQTYQNLLRDVGGRVFPDPRVAELVASANPIQGFGLADEALGLAAMAAGGDFETARSMEAERIARLRQDMPVSTFAAESVGAIAPFIATGGATAAPGLVGQTARAISPQAARTAGGAVARTAGIGGVTGAITGAGEADPGNRVLGAVVGGGLGAVAGPALGALAGGAGRVVNMGQRAAQQFLGRGADAIPAPQVRPSDELREVSRAAYEAVDAVNARYRPQATRELVDNINDAMREFDLNQELHPRAYARWQLIRQRSGLDLSLRELDQQRQLIRRDVASSRDPAEAEAGRRMIEEIDNFIATAGPERMSEGGGREAAQAIETARQAHRRYRKVELLEDALERTLNREQSGNPDQVLRAQVRGLLESPRTRNAFTPDERQALQRFVRGAPGEQVLRELSRFSPLRGTLPSLFAIGAPFLADPLAIVPATGLAADVAYNAMRRNARRDLMEQVALTQDELALLQAQRAGRAAPARAIGAAGAAVGGMGAGRVAPE